MSFGCLHCVVDEAQRAMTDQQVRTMELIESLYPNTWNYFCVETGWIAVMIALHEEPYEPVILMIEPNGRFYL